MFAIAMVLSQPPCDLITRPPHLPQDYCLLRLLAVEDERRMYTTVHEFRWVTPRTNVGSLSLSGEARKLR